MDAPTEGPVKCELLHFEQRRIPTKGLRSAPSPMPISLAQRRKLGKAVWFRSKLGSAIGLSARADDGSGWGQGPANGAAEGQRRMVSDGLFVGFRQILHMERLTQKFKGQTTKQHLVGGLGSVDGAACGSADGTHQDGSDDGKGDRPSKVLTMAKHSWESKT